MASTPPNPPSFQDENAFRVASESLTHYDQVSDTYHCSLGPPLPSLSIRDPERELIVRVDPSTGQVLGFSIPDFRAWHSRHADEGGEFSVDLPPVWPLGPDEPGATTQPDPLG